EEKHDFASEDPDAGIPPMIDIDVRAQTQAIELNSIFNRNLYSKLALTHSYIESHVQGGTVYNVNSRPELYNLRQDVTLKPTPHHDLKAGFELSYNDYYIQSSMPLDPSDTYTSWDSTGMPLDDYDFSKEYYFGGAYLQDSYTVIPQLTLTGGFRFDYHFWTENPDLMPRLSARYELTDKTALRAAWGEYRMFKDPMLLQVNESMDSDKAVHYIAGLNHDFNHSLSGWVEIYYKDYSHLTTADSTGYFTDDGGGYSQGIEFFLQRKLGALTGWVNYSLSEAKRREYLDSREFDFDYDQTHIANLVLEYKSARDQKWAPDVIGTSFRYYTGRPYTPTVGAEPDGFGNFIPVKGETNSVRYGDFHALSLRMEWQFPVFRTAKGKFYLEAWNLYDRKNETGVNYVYGDEYPSNVEERPYYSTPFILGGGLGIDF
ncbi:MAG: TonB-dependent receptor, partial [FCB group bacterium]|nr:TonB-dependent receptor [FCB group bacterium]